MDLKSSLRSCLSWCLHPKFLSGLHSLKWSLPDGKEQEGSWELCLSMCEVCHSLHCAGTYSMTLPCAEGKCSTPTKWRQIKQWIKNLEIPYRFGVCALSSDAESSISVTCSKNRAEELHTWIAVPSEQGSCHAGLSSSASWAWIHGQYLLLMSQLPQELSQVMDTRFAIIQQGQR